MDPDSTASAVDGRPLDGGSGDFPGAPNQGDTSGFGSLRQPRNGAPATGGVPSGRREPSVVDSSARGGGSNVTGGVVRRKKRVIKGMSSVNYDVVQKNYNTSSAVLFNNFDELLQDKISREYAQDIIEEFFRLCDVDLSSPETAKYAEDALFMFVIATTASNKADYDKQIDVPTKSGSVELDFSKFSRLLEYGHGITRRNFSRGIADSQRAFLRQPENTHILPALATRVGCDPQFAYLAFDGSTHCTGMTTRQVSFTKTLEARNLFESDDVLAAGASERLMQGMPSGTRSLVPR